MMMLCCYESTSRVNSPKITVQKYQKNILLSPKYIAVSKRRIQPLTKLCFANCCHYSAPEPLAFMARFGLRTLV